MTALIAAVLAAGLLYAAYRLWIADSAKRFDEHTTTALALLQPDDPALPDGRLSFIEQVEAYVAAHAPKES